VRSVSWLLGCVLGLIAGGAVLVGGVLALLLRIPAVGWAVGEKARPLGLGGLLVGLGAGSAGLLVLANARCASSTVTGANYASGCVAPDLAAFFVAGAVLMAAGVAVSLFAVVHAKGSRSI
jgi:hypothetical protein